MCKKNLSINSPWFASTLPMLIRFFQLVFENRYYNKRCVFNKVQRMNLHWKYFPTYMHLHIRSYRFFHIMFRWKTLLFESLILPIKDWDFHKNIQNVRLLVYHLFIYTHTLPLHNTWYILLVIKQSFLSL